MNDFTACIDLPTPSSPVARTAASVCYSDDLDRCVRHSIDHRVRESAQKIFPGAVRMPRPALRLVANGKNAIVQSRYKSSGGSRVALGIPIVSRLGFGDSAGVKSNAWRGHRIVRGFAGVPPTREPFLLFPGLGRRYAVRSLYSTPIQHLHRRHRPSCPISGQPGRHAPLAASAIPLQKLSVERVSCSKSIRLAEIRQCDQPKKSALVFTVNSAKQIGLTIPPQVLARADRVIK